MTTDPKQASSNSPVSAPLITSSPSSPGSDNILISINAVAQLPLKLTPTNYPSWRAQFNSLLIGFDLMGYVDGSHPCPPKIVLEAHNPAYTFWRRHDQLLLHAIIASASEQVIFLLASATTSHEAWTKLTKLYASRSHSRVMSLKDRLAKPRGSQSVTAYLQTLKATSDELALIDAPIHEDDLALHILKGLGSEFKEISGAIRARDTSISFEELHDKLVDYEAILNKEDAQRSPNFQQGQPQSRHNHGSNSHNHRPSTQSQGHGYKGDYKGFCQLCDQQGHTAKRCPHAQSLQSHNPVANCTTSARYPSQNWLVDSAASHHVTADLNNLSAHSLYDGPDDIVIGNGSGSLQVSHVSTADQFADALTKPLSRQRLSFLRSKIGVSNGTTILRGHVNDKDKDSST
ncbi:hypothetical protein Vadar_011483 [Vaccinium darrowii]|uniref:Uncharacterized protein n=1 Tax=Vaccinium darrowii TaxID=229202 RepID=A0ACB7Y5Z4_9ERIC|nr:hypothetical protein Vadar_011483 [Vaccinium darrowii]